MTTTMTKCPYCIIPCASEESMKTHYMTAHATTSEKKAYYKYYCEACDHGTQIDDMWKTHYFVLHATAAEKKAHYKYYCEACNEGMQSECSMISHSVIHNKKI
jgi:hypothetical protein